MAIYDQLPLFNNSTAVASLIGEVSENLGLPLPSASTDAGARRITTHLNHIQSVMVRRHPWRDLEVTDSSTIVTKDKYAYPLPSDCFRITSARLIDDTCAVMDEGDSGWTAGSSTVLTHDTSFFKTGGASVKTVLTASSDPGISYSRVRAGTLTSVADGSSTRSTFTVAAHGLKVGDLVTIEGTTNYNGTYTVIGVPLTTTFTIRKAYTAETLSGATWRHASSVHDMSTWYNAAIGYWIWANTEMAPSDITINLSEATGGAGTTVTLASPRIPQRQWTYVKHTGVDLTDLNALLTVGVNPTTVEGTIKTVLYIDSIHAYQNTWGGQTWPLRVVDRKVLDKHAPSIDYITGSRPTVLAQSGKSFELFRKPDGNYPLWIRYIKIPQSFIFDDGDSTHKAYDGMVCDIEGVDDVLIAGATWLGMNQRKQWDSAGQWEARFRRAMAEAMNADANADGWEPIMQGFSRAKGLDTSALEVPVGENSVTARGDISGFYNIPI